MTSGQFRGMSGAMFDASSYGLGILTGAGLTLVMELVTAFITHRREQAMKRARAELAKAKAQVELLEKEQRLWRARGVLKRLRASNCTISVHNNFDGQRYITLRGHSLGLDDPLIEEFNQLGLSMFDALEAEAKERADLN